MNEKQPLETPRDSDVPQRVTRIAPPRASRYLFPASTALVLAACGYYAYTSALDEPLQLYGGIAMLVFAALPGLLWARAGGKQLPLFEVLMLTTANTYALPLLSGHQLLRMFSDEAINTAVGAVLLYQCIAVGTYLAVRGRAGRSRFFTEEVISETANRYIGYGLTLSTIYSFVVTFTEVIPRDLAGVLRAVFNGIGMVAIFVQARRWGLGGLNVQQRALFLINLVLQILIQFATLFLIGGISITVLALLGYVAGSRKLPLIAIAIILPIVALLHNGKGAMRAKYWDEDGNRRQTRFSELPELYSEWVNRGLPTSDPTAEQPKMTEKLLERTSLLHILCIVVSSSPSRQPFLDGETYAHIPAQFVPRFFWPAKPLAHISTYRLSIYYGLQREEDTAKTTIGFGLVPEAYANFGLMGVGLLGAALGFGYKKIQSLAANSPLLSYAGLVTIVLMAWSFQTEYPLSMWLSSMFQALVAVLGIPFALRNVFG